MTNMSEIMSKKISVLDISIDNFTAKEAMQEALAYMESDLVSVIELVTIESLMELGTEAELKEEIENFDLILAGNKTILEAARDYRSQVSARDGRQNIFKDVFKISGKKA